MGLTNLARNVIADAITGGATYPRYNNANAYLGVGDTNTAFAASQTDLQGAAYPTNKVRKPMNTGFPSVAANVITWAATFATGEANFAWAERAVFNAASPGGTMLSRHVAAMGTKTSSFSWTLTCTDTILVA